MAFKKRRQHQRLTRSGKRVEVGAHWVRFDEIDVKRQSRRAGRCPTCGAKISYVPNPRGGRVILEAGMGNRRIKHSCAHIGEGLSKRRPEAMGDLFERCDFLCPSCGAYELVMIEGCMTCRACGHSKCS